MKYHVFSFRFSCGGGAGIHGRHRQHNGGRGPERQIRVLREEPGDIQGKQTHVTCGARCVFAR